MAFNKKRADDRKDWLGNYNKDSVLDTDKKLIPFSDFINRELIHFSKYDCERSIPNGIDGLKISQTQDFIFGIQKKTKERGKGCPIIRIYFRAFLLSSWRNKSTKDYCGNGARFYRI